MLIANSATHKLFSSDYHQQNNRLQTSMARLASGQRMVSPGRAPAELGISERFRAQVRNSNEAGRVIQNAINMFSSGDSWLQQVHDILGRMSELAIGASDGSKNEDDRKNLDLEFQQLKSEISRISEAGKYNGLQVNGNTAVGVYDFDKETIVYTQPDGSDQRELDISLAPGTTSKNGIAYDFVNTTDTSGEYVGDFMFTEDGKSLLYFNQTSGSVGKRVMKLDLETDMITRTNEFGNVSGSAFGAMSRFVMDDAGRVWLSKAGSSDTNAARGYFDVALLDVDKMKADVGGLEDSTWAGSIELASGYGLFAVHNDEAYYIRDAGSDIYDDATLQSAAATASTLSQMVFSLGGEVHKNDFVLSVGGTRQTYDTNYSLAKVTDAISNSDSGFNGTTNVFDISTISIYDDKPSTFSAKHVQIFKADSGSSTYNLLVGGGTDYTFDPASSTDVTFTSAIASGERIKVVINGVEESDRVTIMGSTKPTGAVHVDYRDKYQYVKRSIYNTSDVEVIIDNCDMANDDLRDDVMDSAPYMGVGMSTYSVSKDGLYLAWESDNGEITLMNTVSEKTAKILVSSSSASGTNQNTINAISFDSNNNLYWTNTGVPANQNSISRVSIKYGDQPEVGDVIVIKNANVKDLGTDNYGDTPTNLYEQGRGLSIMGGSPASNYLFQVGPDKGMDVEFSTSNAELVRLGLSRLDVTSMEDAQVSIEAIAKAIDKVANERAIIGSEVSRLQFTYNANDAYGNNIAQAESRIRDVEFADETAKLARAQVLSQSAISMLLQSNTDQQSVLRLLG